MAKGLFKKTKYITISKAPLDDNIYPQPQEESKPSIPNGMWAKCDKCGEIIYKKDLEDNLMVTFL